MEEGKTLSALKERVKGKVLLLGVGNILRGDDGVGPIIVKELKGKVDLALIECGETPENYLGKIIGLNPDTVIIIDAIDFGTLPGRVAIIEPEKLIAKGLSTHNFSLRVVIEYLKREIKADIFLLGVQPKSLGFGERMSTEVEGTIELIKDFFIKVFPKDKATLRKEIIRLRDSQSKGEIDRKSAVIEERLFSLPLWERVKTVMFYVAMRSEVRTEGMIKRALRMGKRVVVPLTKLKERKLLLSELRDYDQELKLSTFQIPEPKAEYYRPVDLKEIDIIVVPGIVFDEKGYRIGYGGGFYDRLLSSLPSGLTTIGLAFELQIVRELPTEVYDMKVNLVITEERIIECGDYYTGR